MMRSFALLLFVAAMQAMSAEPVASPSFDVPAHYEKSEHRIAMRDGVRLHTVIYAPRDRSQRYPILLSRSPYSVKPYGPAAYMETTALAPSEAFLRDGYIIAMQDVRGAYMSEGEFVYLRPPDGSKRETDESTDTWDTIEWLVRNVPRNNGRVGQWGISYDGWQTVMSLVKPHPALRAASPQATTADAFIGDDNHFNGTFYLSGSLGWAGSMTLATGADRAALNGEWKELPGPAPHWDYEFFLRAGPTADINRTHFGGRLGPLWEDLIAHPDYDEYWRRRNVASFLGRVDIPVLSVAGWFDHADPYGTFATYRAIEAANPRNRSTIVAGPWNHGGWLWEDGAKLGVHDFGSATSSHYRDHIIFPFFQHHLKGKHSRALPEVVAFETGGNVWRQFDHWPPRSVTTRVVYFAAEGRLAFEGPPPPSRAPGGDSYVSDPEHPVPFTTAISLTGGVEHMLEDQRAYFTRPDVLSYQTEPLTEDLTIAGNVLVSLFAATTGTDSDWFVKLIDVYPADAGEMAGFESLVAFNVMRGKYRDSFRQPAPMTPGRVTPISLQLPDRLHRFRKGHRIMVQVQSSMFPLFDRNPQVFTNIYRAAAGDYVKATQTIYRSAGAASVLQLPVLPADRK